MTTQKRKEREKKEKRELILNAARDIIAESGIDELSMRKIANRIEYSPAVIYNYFENKNEIIKQLMQEGYQKIIQSLKGSESSKGNAEERIQYSIKNYIEMVLQSPDEYKIILLNNSPEILKHTSVLDEGASDKRKALAILYQNIKEFCQEIKVDSKEFELITQIIWTSTFGLVIRLIIENNIPEEQKNKLINRHLEFILDSLYQFKNK